jgi:hypothetical protein
LYFDDRFDLIYPEFEGTHANRKETITIPNFNVERVRVEIFEKLSLLYRTEKAAIHLKFNLSR